MSSGPGQGCPCRSGQSYDVCCGPFHSGAAKPETAEQLMRSRYTAYFRGLVDYLVETAHPDTRSPRLKSELEKTIHLVQWIGLEILKSSQGGPSDKIGKVHFVATYLEPRDPVPHRLEEHSRFRRFQGNWKYLDGKG